MAYFVVSVFVLAGLLFIPVSKLIWVFSVRRMQRRLQRELSADEIAGQLRRARFLTIFVVLAFSFLFNYHVVFSRG